MEIYESNYMACVLAMERAAGAIESAADKWGDRDTAPESPAAVDKQLETAIAQLTHARRMLANAEYLRLQAAKEETGT